MERKKDWSVLPTRKISGVSEPQCDYGLGVVGHRGCSLMRRRVSCIPARGVWAPLTVADPTGATTHLPVAAMSPGASVSASQTNLKVVLAGCAAIMAGGRGDCPCWPARADPDTIREELTGYGIYGQQGLQRWIGKIPLPRLYNGVDADAYSRPIAPPTADDKHHSAGVQLLGGASNPTAPSRTPTLQGAAEQR